MFACDKPLGTLLCNLTYLEKEIEEKKISFLVRVRTRAKILIISVVRHLVRKLRVCVSKYESESNCVQFGCEDKKSDKFKTP